MQSNYETLKVEIDNIKDDIREIKMDQKETNNFFREAIDKLTTTQIQQTEILKNQTDQQKIQFAKVNEEIADLNDKIDNTLQSQTKWYQDFLGTNFGLVVKILVISVLLLAGVKLVGINLSKIFNM